ncbi:PREDICTED: cystatin-A-like [Eurypyga helias]|uniref:Cystatin-A n=1 Tax=Eurypyga helias TaxID=54383 RepID=A0A093JBB5_EURHL|nr:PREDICTED: cystatin-A-like [Eurypyga helias]KFW09172.1 Cystatin-A [Eurypyga helias]
MMPGGLSETKCATPEVQLIADKVKPQLENMENCTYDIFEAIEYRSQVVAGVNYFIKVQVSETEYVHLKVFEVLPSPDNDGPILTGFQTGKTRDDPLTFF